ncbi:hypothetical protein AYT02_002547 [Salmonella enterica]|nr:hypothetical protein [Salmonella enterica]
MLSGKTEKINFSIDILELEWEYNRLWSLSVLPKNRFVKNKSWAWVCFLRPDFSINLDGMIKNFHQNLKDKLTSI